MSAVTRQMGGRTCDGRWPVSVAPDAGRGEAGADPVLGGVRGAVARQSLARLPDTHGGRTGGLAVVGLVGCGEDKRAGQRGRDAESDQSGREASGCHGGPFRMRDRCGPDPALRPCREAVLMSLRLGINRVSAPLTCEDPGITIEG